LNTEGIFAAGAELVNCFCIGRGNQAILSQHIGDLKNLETLEFYTESINRYRRMFRFKPDMIVHDMHPDYLSTRYAIEFSEKENIERIEVQHHHAHIASCMVEHGLDEKVLGVSFDGVGYGDDGNIWGGEFLICDLLDYERPYHFEYTQMPGGDLATKNPWRMAISYLLKAIGPSFRELGLTFLENIPEQEIDLVELALNKKINTPLTSSAGRLFDAVSALLNLCTKASFHAEAPMRLESILSPGVKEDYVVDIKSEISFDKMFKEIVDDLSSNVDPGIISARFHNTIISTIFAVASEVRAKTGIASVVLSGGSFQNKYILENVEILLRENNFNVYSQSMVPSNDGGIALGQLAIAAKRRNN
jgi:hydrogenase maturation protein HypF